jgi:hypothetical protein
VRRLKRSAKDRQKDRIKKAEEKSQPVVSQEVFREKTSE